MTSDQQSLVEREMRRADRNRRRVIGASLIAGALAAFLILVVIAVALGAQGADARSTPAVQPVPRTVAPSAASAAPSTTPSAEATAPASTSVAKATPAQGAPAATQRFSIRIGSAGYEPSVVTASSDRPISLTVGRGEGCAAGFIMGSLGIEKDNSSGPVTIDLGKLEPGTYAFTCGMGMVEGKLVVL